MTDQQLPQYATHPETKASEETRKYTKRRSDPDATRRNTQFILTMVLTFFSCLLLNAYQLIAE
jgi:hypothetical protein